MALLTTCQASFQSMKDYEDVKDDVESLKENVRECYSEISKTSEQIQHTVRETYLTKSELETIQKDFQASITQNSSEIRMDFTKITNEIINNVSANQTLLEEYIRFKGALIELGKVGKAKDISDDQQQTLITSANLSYHGQQGNIELGTLIESKQIAKQIDDVFTKLIFSKIFSEV